MNQNLVDTFTITAIGMTIVFIVLIVLAMCFSAMKLIAGGKKDKAKKADPPRGDGVEASTSVPEPVDSNDDELAVVISAALAAFLDNRFVVRSIRRLEDTASWSGTGRHDQMVSKLR